jgi:hypothetical protein
MITHQLLASEGILVLTPQAPLEAADFEQIAREVDPYIEQNGKLHGILIDAETFPGWKDFAGMLAHMRFVKNHHQNIERVAVVSDSTFLSIAPKIAGHFVQADVRHFSHSQKDDAFRWLTGGNQ